MTSTHERVHGENAKNMCDVRVYPGTGYDVCSPAEMKEKKKHYCATCFVYSVNTPPFNIVSTRIKQTDPVCGGTSSALVEGHLLELALIPLYA